MNLMGVPVPEADLVVMGFTRQRATKAARPATTTPSRIKRQSGGRGSGRFGGTVAAGAAATPPKSSSRRVVEATDVVVPSRVTQLQGIAPRDRSNFRWERVRIRHAGP